MINLELSVQEINLILQALGQAPYVQVAELMTQLNLIQSQIAKLGVK